MSVLGEYHEALGDLVFGFEGTLERFTGDGLMVFFNDPMPCADAPLRAVRMAVAMRNRVERARGALASQRARPRLCRRDQAWIRHARSRRIRGSLRLCRDWNGDEPRVLAFATRQGAGQILVSPRVHAEVEALVVSNEVGELELKGFSRPVTAYEIQGVDAARLRAYERVALNGGADATLV